MNDWTARNPYPGSCYDQTCSFCGAILRVESQLQDGHNEREEYYCPECHKEYGVRACFSPTVELIKGRSDGRTCRYTDKD